MELLIKRFQDRVRLQHHALKIPAQDERARVPLVQPPNACTVSLSRFVMRIIPLLCFVSLPFLAGCVAVLPPFPELERGATPSFDPSKTFTVLREIVWYGTGASKNGFRLPVGRYTLEAEDADYWYFHAPERVEFYVLERGMVTERRRGSGGIMIAKRTTSLTAMGYIDGKGSTKSPIGELSGTEFGWMEGKYWKKNL